MAPRPSPYGARGPAPQAPARPQPPQARPPQQRWTPPPVRVVDGGPRFGRVWEVPNGASLDQVPKGALFYGPDGSIHRYDAARTLVARAPVYGAHVGDDSLFYYRDPYNPREWPRVDTDPRRGAYIMSHGQQRWVGDEPPPAFGGADPRQRPGYGTPGDRVLHPGDYAFAEMSPFRMPPSARTQGYARQEMAAQGLRPDVSYADPRKDAVVQTANGKAPPAWEREPDLSRWKPEQERRRDRLEPYRDNPNIRAWWDTLGPPDAEGSDRYGYHTGYNFQYLSDLSAHPGVAKDGSSASGRFQIDRKTWGDIGQGQLGLTHFYRPDQELAILGRMERAHILDRIASGDIVGSIPGAAQVWASVPEGPGGKNRSRYKKAGGNEPQPSMDFYDVEPRFRANRTRYPDAPYPRGVTEGWPW